MAGTRTRDQCLKRALLYQLSYQPNQFKLKLLRTIVKLKDINLSPVKTSGQASGAPSAAPWIMRKVAENLSRPKHRAVTMPYFSAEASSFAELSRGRGWKRVR